MRGYKREFIELALELGVLRFGEFTLKSGRVSPYFFNAGLFNTGYAAAKLGRFYAEAIAESGVRFDMLFGPAYKGIPLATLAAASLAEQHDIDVPYSFNRKSEACFSAGNMVPSCSWYSPNQPLSTTKNSYPCGLSFSAIASMFASAASS